MSTQTEREQIATLNVEVRELREDVADLKAEVRNLTAALNQGRGGLAVLSFIIGSSLVAAIAAITGMFK